MPFSGCSGCVQEEGALSLSPTFYRKGTHPQYLIKIHVKRRLSFICLPIGILIPTPRGVYYFLSLTLSVCMSVCLSCCSFKLMLLFLFIDGIELLFGHHLSMWHSTKLFSSIFDLGPLTPKIYSPKFEIAQHRL